MGTGDDRAQPRLEEKHMIHVRVVESPDGEEDLSGHTVTCHTIDYSLGGINIPVTKALPPDTRVLVTVSRRSPARSISDIPGRIAWARRTDGAPPYALGIEFTDWTPEQAADWKSIVRAGLIGS